MTTPTVPPTTEPVEDPCISGGYGNYPYGTTRDGLLPCDPDTGLVIEWPPPAPPADECVPSGAGTYPGTMRISVLPCDPATGEIIEWPIAEPQAVASVGTNPAPVEQTLPVTGAAETAVWLVVATAFVAVGASMRRFATR